MVLISEHPDTQEFADYAFLCCIAASVLNALVIELEQIVYRYVHVWSWWKIALSSVCIAGVFPLTNLIYATSDFHIPMLHLFLLHAVLFWIRMRWRESIAPQRQ